MQAASFTQLLQVKVPAGFRESLVAAAREDQTSVSEFVRRALRAQLSRASSSAVGSSNEVAP